MVAHFTSEPLSRIGTGLWSPAARTAPEATRVGELQVECRPLLQCQEIAAEWRALALRTIEPNVFSEPAFILAAARHLPEANGHLALLVWDDRGAGERRLLAFWPMRRPRRRAGHTLMRGFASRYSCSGVPLLDRDVAIEAACALYRYLQDAPDTPAGSLFPQMPLDGPAARALRAAASLSDLPTAERGVHWRACVARDAAGGSTAPSSSGRLRREMNRVARRLAQEGDVRLLTARTPEAVRDAVELFLAQESSGWKARRGTAMLCDTRDAAFFRSLTRTLARDGQIAVHLLEVGQRVAATGVVLLSGDRAWYVKTSHDERLAAHGPGAMLSYEIAAGDGGQTPALLDSCAVAGHAMIERLWKDRLRVGELVIGLGPGLNGALRNEMRRERLRAFAKRIYYCLRGLGPTGVPR